MHTAEQTPPADAGNCLFLACLPQMLHLLESELRSVVDEAPSARVLSEPSLPRSHTLPLFVATVTSDVPYVLLFCFVFSSPAMKK